MQNTGKTDHWKGKVLKVKVEKSNCMERKEIVPFLRRLYVIRWLQGSYDTNILYKADKYNADV